MKTPKSLQNLADSIGCFIEQLRFNGNGQTNKGFCIVDMDANELMEIEPVFYRNGDRWKVVNKVKGTLIYLKSLRQIKNAGSIHPGLTGYKFTSLSSGPNNKPLVYVTIEKR